MSTASKSNQYSIGATYGVWQDDLTGANWHAGDALSEDDPTVLEMMDSKERRNADRFAIEREVKYKAMNRKGMEEAGTGKTINMSSNGILFATDQMLLPGRRMEIQVSWPAQLDNACPLKLVAKAKVVRSDARTAAVEILQYEFRTQARAAGV